jgi:hypothetical protein
MILKLSELTLVSGIFQGGPSSGLTMAVYVNLQKARKDVIID